MSYLQNVYVLSLKCKLHVKIGGYAKETTSEKYIFSEVRDMDKKLLPFVM